MTSIVNHAEKLNQNTQKVKIKWTTTQDRYTTEAQVDMEQVTHR